MSIHEDLFGFEDYEDYDAVYEDILNESINNPNEDNYGVEKEFTMDDIMLESSVASMALGFAEEISDAEAISKDDKVEMLSLFDGSQSNSQLKKTPPAKSFEAWVRSINNGSKKINDPL